MFSCSDQANLPQRDTQSFMSMQEIDEEKYQKSVKRKI